jgi:hypothetical protein
MRDSNHGTRGRRLSALTAGLFGLVFAACAATAAVPPPSVAPTPSPTPDPHLTEPVTADHVYSVLTAAKLGMACSNANLGNGNPRIVKQINCNVGGWPLRITQYKTTAMLTSSLKWTPDGAPTGDEPPYGWAGLNVLVEFGPISARAPSKPAADRQATAKSILGVLDPLLWPIAQHSVAAIPGRTAEPTVVPSATAAPSKAPTAKRRSAKPPTKTPRPSKAP